MFIEKNNAGRRFAMSDIHGCYNVFARLLDKIQLSKQDQLFILGDCIDRGKQSRQVLETIINLQSNDYQVFVTLGNHEKSFLTACQCGKDFLQTYTQKYNSQDLLHGDLEAYLEFIQKMPYYLESDNFLLSHAGFNFGAENPFTDYRGMYFPTRNISAEKYKGEKYVIHGHFVQYRQDIENSAQNSKRIIGIDNGCFYQETVGLGNLCALELDTFALHFEENR